MPPPENLRRLVLMDGHSLAYRAFYAMPPLSLKTGEPINAVLGFTNMLLRFIEDEKPTHVALSFDRGRPAARTQMFAEYKGGRDHMPEDLNVQIPIIEDVIHAFGIPIFTSLDHEADDCIGTLARRAEAEGFDDVVLVSGDLDLLQLVNAKTRVMATIRGITDTVRYDEKAVAARFGFPPVRIPDFKALAGDSSDNIPGVPGIGKGTASKLIEQFGSVENMLEHGADLPPRWRDKMLEMADRIRMFRNLATIDTHVPLEFTWDDCRWTRVPASARELLEQLEFRRIVERLGLDREDQPEAGVQPGAPRPPITLTRTEDAADVARYVGDAARVGIAAIREHGQTIAIGVAVDGDHGIAIGLRSEAPAVEQLSLEPMAQGRGLPRDAASDLLASLQTSTREIWAFDVKSFFVEWHGARLEEGAWRDVGVASYLLESSESQKSLQAIATRHGTRVPPEAEILVGRGAKLQPWAGVDEAERDRFVAETAAAAFELARVLPERLREQAQEELFLTLEMPLQRILARMERRGVKVDVPYLRALGREMEAELEAVRKDIIALAGFEFNVNSPKQLGEVLFERLGIPGGKRTKVGQYITDAETLQKLAEKHPVCARIIDYREVAKLAGTYVDALPRLVDATDHVHTSWNGTVAATGRLSSSEPNVQNIPIRSALGRRIRRAFIPSRPGRLLLSADYSQIELRVMAHLSGDARLVAIFNDGGDVHAATAAQVFGVAREAVTADMRRKSKEVNFGILYGMGPDSLGQRIGVSRKEAREFIDRYLENFTGVRDMMRETVRKAEQVGYVETMLGRRRWLPDIRSRNRMLKAAAERMATNAPIQGSAADLIKLAMVRLANERPDLDLLLQVHDELVFEVAADALHDTAIQIRDVMATALPMSVPIVVDVKAGANWAEMSAVELDAVAAVQGST